MNLARTFLTLAAALTAAAAQAQIYKWVDERGVVNYSNRPPQGQSVTRVNPKAVAVSVYSPDSSLARAMAARSGELAALERRLARLEEELYAERRARAYAIESEARERELAREQCLANHRADCDYAYGYGPYGYGYTPAYAYPPAYVLVLPGMFFHRARMRTTMPVAGVLFSSRPSPAAWHLQNQRRAAIR